MERVRPPTVAGSFYPAEPEELIETLEQCFVSHSLGPQGRHIPSPSVIGGMVPHAGYVYSGPCAAHFYSAIDSNTRCIILLGVNHRGEGARGALSPADFWETPLGKVSIEHDLSKELEKRCDFLESDERSHAHEHSIEVQLPFLQTILDNFVLLPVALSHLSAEECRQLGRAIACAYETATLSGNKTIIIASSDLNHYIPPERIEKLDRTALEPVLALDAPRLLDTIEHNEMTMCGVVPTAVLLFAAEALRAKRARLLKYCHSGDATPMDTVVGYASISVEL